ncbi:MAG TPA: hypothetical protein VGC86_08190 [Afipia sp.]
MHTAIGRSLVIAVATSLCFITASYALPVAGTAATAGKPLVLVKATRAKPVSKKSARLHRSERKTAKANEKVVPKPAIASNETPDGQAAPTASAALPPQVANAHAELTTGDLQSSESPSTLTEADKIARIETASNGVQIAAADQLNDIDRDLAAQTPASTAPVQTAALADSQSTTAQSFISQSQGLTGQGLTGQGWNGAALIGKIFIGLGAMLTLASAARMLIA